jgi:hypothetical protein
LKKQSRAEFGAAMLFKLKLFLNGSFNRAGLCAVSAIDAGVSVDNELAVTLGDATNGASVSASAAANAFIRNLVCHLE